MVARTVSKSERSKAKKDRAAASKVVKKQVEKARAERKAGTYKSSKGGGVRSISKKEQQDREDRGGITVDGRERSSEETAAVDKMLVERRRSSSQVSKSVSTPSRSSQGQEPLPTRVPIRTRVSQPSFGKQFVSDSTKGVVQENITNTRTRPTQQFNNRPIPKFTNATPGQRTISTPPPQISLVQTKKPTTTTQAPSTVEAGFLNKREDTPVGRVEDLLSKQRETIRTQTERSGGAFTFKQAATTIGIGAATSVIGTGRFFKNLVTRPVQTTVGAAKGVYTLGKQVVSGAGVPALGVLKSEPFFAFGYIGGEIAGAKGAGAVAKAGSKAFSFTRTVLSPRYKPVTTIDDVKVIQATKDVKIELAGGTASTAEPISQQAKLAGQEVTAVSAQRNLFGTVKRKITVDKPKPTASSPELERSFFADPRSRVRQSRLGLEKKPSASLQDVLSGNVQYGSTKPQILFFEGVRVEKFPANLGRIEAKLKTGQTLSPVEAAQLEKWQMTPSGQFKPVGFVGLESEITLAPGEIIKGTKVGPTILQGKRVEIFRSEITTGSKRLQELTKKTTRTVKEEAELSRLMSKETGGLSSRPVSSAPVISPAGSLTGAVSLGSGSVDPTSKPLSVTPVISPSVIPYTPPKYDPGRRGGGSRSKPSPVTPSQIVPSPVVPSPRVPSPRVPSPISPVPRSPVPTSPRPNPWSPVPTSPRPNPRTPSPVIPKLAPKPFQRQRSSGGIFSVQVRREGTFQTIGSGLSSLQAFRLGKRVVSNTAAASFRVSSGGSATTRGLSAPSGFRMSTRESGVFIERRERRISTGGELRQITLKGVEASKKKKKKKGGLFSL